MGVASIRGDFPCKDYSLDLGTGTLKKDIVSLLDGKQLFAGFAAEVMSTPRLAHISTSCRESDKQGGWHEGRERKVH